MEENIKYSYTQVNFLNAFFDEVNQSQLDYCILRNFEQIPNYIGNDIDFLLNPKHSNKFLCILEKVASKFDYSLRYDNDRFCSLKVSLINHKDDEIITIDILTKSLKMFFEYADSNYILKTKIPYKNFFVPQRGCIMYTILVKDTLTYSYLRKKNLPYFNLVSLDDKESFINSGRGFFSSEFLEEIFCQIMRQIITINKRELFIQLNIRYSTNIRYILSFFTYRVKDLFK